MSTTGFRRLAGRVASIILASLMFLMVTITYLGIDVTNVYADVVATGCVKVGTTDVRIRTAPNTADDSNIITSVDGGKSLDILGEEFTSNNYSWYKVGFYNGATYTEGYIAAMYVTVYDNVDYGDYADFKDYLTQQGFPESYHNALIELHARYPKWIFKADKTNLDWSYVVEQENVNGRSLVPSYYDTSKKSTAYGCYDWTTDEYTIWDSGGWVQASSAMVEYYLDPRNFLDSTHIFMFENLSYNGQIQTESGLTSMVSGTFLDASRNDLSYGDNVYPTYVSALLAAGQISGVSPFHLASRMIQELGSADHASISGTVSGYEGYYNYYHIGAYKTVDYTAIQNGLRYAKATDEFTLRPWSTRMLAIIGGAKFIGRDYINAGQNTIYYEKFDLKNFYHQYMTNIQAASSESVSAANGYSESIKQNTELSFLIPVYNNMPDKTVYPTGGGSVNNRLSSLSISGYNLTPTFAHDTFSYNLIVPYNVSSIEISATTMVSSAIAAGTGTFNLTVGNNDFKIRVTAENGSTQDYDIRVVREQISNGSADGSFTSNYKVDDSIKCISGIGVGTTGQSFIDGITFNTGRGIVVKDDGTEQTGKVATGNRLLVYDAAGNISGEYKLVVYGDVNGDGEITSLDMLYVYRHVLDLKKTEGAKLYASDANHDGEVTSLDMVYIKRDVLGIRYIEQ